MSDCAAMVQDALKLRWNHVESSSRASFLKSGHVLVLLCRYRRRSLLRRRPGSVATDAGKWCGCACHTLSKCVYLRRVFQRQLIVCLALTGSLLS
jgi:hypothetical protein